MFNLGGGGSSEAISAYVAVVLVIFDISTGEYSKPKGALVLQWTLDIGALIFTQLSCSYASLPL